MQETEQASARERRSVRHRANQIQRAISAVYLAVDGLETTDALIAINEVLVDKLGKRRHRLQLVPTVDPRLTAPLVKRAAAG